MMDWKKDRLNGKSIVERILITTACADIRRRLPIGNKGIKHLRNAERNVCSIIDYQLNHRKETPENIKRIVNDRIEKAATYLSKFPKEPRNEQN